VAAIAYVDSSALLKLIVREPETSLLQAHLAHCEGLVVSHLATVECGRALRRATNKRVLQTFEQLLEAIYLVEITPAILDQAARLAPPNLRSLDAIHLATALSIDDPGLELLTYDQRLADAARAHRLRVVQPGR
jgi:uncharacterized protein